MRLTQLTDYALRSFMQYLNGHTLADIHLPGPPDPAATQVIRVQRPARAPAS
jgi:hypothetical protein